MTKLGTRVICKGYLKKLPQRYVVPELTEEELAKADKHTKELYAYGNPIILESSNSIYQPKYTSVESDEFEGIIVDRRIISLGRVFENDYDDLWTGKNRIIVSDCKGSIACYKVYYRLGKSRLVPCFMAEEIKQRSRIND